MTDIATALMKTLVLAGKRYRVVPVSLRLISRKLFKVSIPGSERKLKF